MPKIIKEAFPIKLNRKPFFIIFTTRRNAVDIEIEEIINSTKLPYTRLLISTLVLFIAAIVPIVIKHIAIIKITELLHLDTQSFTVIKMKFPKSINSDVIGIRSIS
jgi:hypothetical protein